MKTPDPWTAIHDGGGGLRAVLIIAQSNCRQMTIYGLVGTDEPKRIRYVGRTMHPESRFDDHLKSGVEKVAQWVRNTCDIGKAVRMVRLEQCDPRRGAQRENFWLQFYKAEGMADLNTARVTADRRRNIA
jgi:hypothetical protein